MVVTSSVNNDSCRFSVSQHQESGSQDHWLYILQGFPEVRRPAPLHPPLCSLDKPSRQPVKRSCCLRETWGCRPSVTPTMSCPAIFHGSEAPGSSSVSSPAPQPPILTASQALMLGHSVPRLGSTGLVQGRAESRALALDFHPQVTPVPTGPQSEPVDRASCPQALDRTGTSSLGVLSRQGLSQSPWTEPAARRSWTEPGQGTPGSCQSEAAGRPRGDLASRTWLLSWPLTSASSALRGGLWFLCPAVLWGLGGGEGKGGSTGY